MNTNRLSKTLAAALNAQMTKEALASQIYLSYAAWADSRGLPGVANFLFRHAQEERNHMMKMLEYILKRGGKVIITAVPAPRKPRQVSIPVLKKYLSTKSIIQKVFISW